jgi:hypothetical protein
MPRFDRGPGTEGEQWQFLGDWVGILFSVGLALKILWAMFPSVSHGAMIEVMLQAGGQLVKSTISLPTPTFAHMVSLAFHAIGMGKVGACIARSR